MLLVACDQSTPSAQATPTACTIMISGAVTQTMATTCGLQHGENIGIVFYLVAPLDDSSSSTRLMFETQTGSLTPAATYTANNDEYANAYLSGSFGDFRAGWCPDFWWQDAPDGGSFCEGVGVPSTSGWFTVTDTTMDSSLTHGTLTLDLAGVFGTAATSTTHVVVTF